MRFYRTSKTFGVGNDRIELCFYSWWPENKLVEFTFEVDTHYLHAAVGIWKYSVVLSIGLTRKFGD